MWFQLPTLLEISLLTLEDLCLTQFASQPVEALTTLVIDVGKYTSREDAQRKFPNIYLLCPTFLSLENDEEIEENNMLDILSLQPDKLVSLSGSILVYLSGKN